MMKMVRWTPAPTVANARRAADLRAREQAWAATQAPRALRPALDIVEREDAVILRVNVPGIAPDDVTIEIHDGVLTLRGEVPAPELPEGARVHTRERHTGPFVRRVRLSDQIDTQAVEASAAHGVLTITLPKIAQAQPRRIKVELA